MHDDLYFAESTYTPEVILKAGMFSFRGRSYPENTYEFYQPVFDWLNAYFADAESPRNIAVDFEISYFNSSSSRVFFDTLKLLDDHRSEFEIAIRWLYDSENDNALESGEEFMDEFPELSITLVVSDE